MNMSTQIFHVRIGGGDMDEWNKTVSGADLIALRKDKAKEYELRRICKDEQPYYADKGWVTLKQYKNGNAIMKKDKNFAIMFVDSLWVMFSGMGFTEMSSANIIFIPCRFISEGYPVSIIAADEETVLLVEVKYHDAKEKSNLSKDLDYFKNNIGEILKTVRTVYPRHKIRFIWATHNLVMQRRDFEQMRELNISHFDDSSIAYYSDLVKHIGPASKYQLLGNLFANQEIANMENRIPAIQGRMGGYTYYSFSIEPEKLLKIGYVLHRNEANAALMPTYQRLIKKKRLQEVRSFVDNGGYFPNSIIISIDTHGKGLEFDLASLKIDSALSRIGILHLPKKYHSAYIIDGQHRLYGYSGSEFAMKNTVPVVAFVDLNRNEQIKLFMDINENQKAVPKTLRVTLNADMLWDSTDCNEQRQALRSKIAQMLGESSTSPLKDRVIVGEGEQTALKAVSVEAIQHALQKTSFFSSFDKKNNEIKHGTFDRGNNEATCNCFYPFIESYFLLCQAKCNDEWERDDGEGIIVINRGIYGLIKVFDDIVNMLIEKKMIFPDEQTAEDMMPFIELYLTPLCEYFNRVSIDERKELKSYLGEGGNTRFWRTFQKVISEKRKEFVPDGLNDYWMNESKAYNADSASYIEDITHKLKDIIETRLEGEFGPDWLRKGLPKDIYLRASRSLQYAEYEQGNAAEKSLWDYVDLADCRVIATYAKNWSTLFSTVLVRDEDQRIPGDKEMKTKWISDVSEINRKMNGNKNYSVTTEQHSFLASIFEWISQILV